ncbi:integrase core domain-containing protein, partial [Rhodococcus pyridinivorans]|uniref:integrase core domain-containing protein n=1 Tax=Rhodococcus pyridinivorans TaxID=103816 RepID=UPI002658452B
RRMGTTRCEPGRMPQPIPTTPRDLPSMGRIGSSADNAMAESFNASLKRETLQGAKRWIDEAQCRTEVFRWITRYNTRRRHSSLRNRSPLDFEVDHGSTLDQAA